MQSLVLLSALYRSRQNFALSHRTIKGLYAVKFQYFVFYVLRRPIHIAWFFFSDVVQLRVSELTRKKSGPVQQCFQHFPKCRQPRPQSAFPWLWSWCRPTSKARENRPGDEVEVSPQVREYGFRNPRNLCL